MIFIDFLGFVLLLLNFLIVFQLCSASLFFIWLVQLKEYRWDRLKTHFETLTGKRQLLDNFNLLKWPRTVFPRMTMRGILVLIIVFFSQYYIFFIFLEHLYSFFLIIPKTLLLASFLSFCFLLWLAPWLAVLGAAISKVICFPWEWLVYKLASNKLETAANLKIVAIAGSYGKTATKEIISFLLEENFQVLKTPLNCNTKLGISLFLLKNLEPKHQFLVVEMGAYKKGEITSICNLIKPQIGLLTGINKQHLALFGSLKKIMAAKYELINCLPPEGLALFNGQDKQVLRLAAQCQQEKIIYGREKVVYKTGLVGNWHQQAIQAGLILGQRFQISKKKMISRLVKMKNFPLGLAVKEGKGGVTVIDDSYSANPTGFLTALGFLNQQKGREKILISPGIIELGKASVGIHQKIGRKAGQICDLIILTKVDFQQPICQGVKKNRQPASVKVIEKPEDIMEKINKKLTKNNLVLLEGRQPAGLKQALLRK